MQFGFQQSFKKFQNRILVHFIKATILMQNNTSLLEILPVLTGRETDKEKEKQVI